MPDAPRLLALLGSVTPPGRMHRALGDAVDRANASGEAIWSFLDLGTLSLGFADGTPIDQLEDDTAVLVEQVSAAGGVLLASPVYRASLTGRVEKRARPAPRRSLAREAGRHPRHGRRPSPLPRRRLAPARRARLVRRAPPPPPTSTSPAPTYPRASPPPRPPPSSTLSSRPLRLWPRRSRTRT